MHRSSFDGVETQRDYETPYINPNLTSEEHRISSAATIFKDYIVHTLVKGHNARMLLLQMHYDLSGMREVLPLERL